MVNRMHDEIRDSRGDRDAGEYAVESRNVDSCNQ
jgi:hypothetical protein